jgi:hypothetical protein
MSRGIEVLSNGTFERSPDYSQLKWEEIYSSSSLQKANMMESNDRGRRFAGGLNSKYLYFAYANSNGYTNITNQLPFSHTGDLTVNRI